MTILYILAGLVALLALYHIGLAMYSRTLKRLFELRNLALDIEQRELTMDMARLVYPDQAGTFPLLLQARSDKVLDPGRGVLLDFDGILAALPSIAQPEQLRRLLLAAGGWPGGEAATNLLPEPGAVQWPTEIPLKSVMTEPDIRNLVLGVTVKADMGRLVTVKADMGHLVHVAVGGSSGWGKSVFLRSLAYQLALSQTPVDLVMVDLEGAALAPFAKCGRLLYPIADTERDALAVLLALQDEMERRKTLYAQHLGVDNLDTYNTQADERLTPLVAIIDEATALLGDKLVETALRTLALRSRKYGLWLVMAGQDWKASSLDTAIRNQLSSRIQFKAMGKSQSRVLLEQSGAEELDTIGRAWAVIPGKSPFLMQTPFISARAIVTDVSDGGARSPMPETIVGSELDAETVKRIEALHEEGVSLRGIAESVFGYYNGRKAAAIKSILGLV